MRLRRAWRCVATRLALCPVALSLATGCAESDTYFCSLPAKFSFQPVTSISQLYTSLNSQGEWCTITLASSKFVFANLSGTGTANQTAVTGYTGFYMGLSGFIVGLPNMPELGADAPVVTCYDLACAACYAERSVTKPLKLQTGGYGHCTSCDITYDLNNQGQPADLGANTFAYENPRSLYRYRVTYLGDVLVINN